jgi:hypothetical protein
MVSTRLRLLLDESVTEPLAGYVLVQREDEGEVRSKGRDSALRAGIFKA